MVGGCAVIALVAVIAPRASALARPAVVVNTSGSSPELERVDRNIDFWTGAANIDSFSAFFAAHKAAQLIQRARLTGEAIDAERAELEARRSLALRTHHNGGAFVTLAASLLEQHRFTEARDIARQLVAGQPDVDVYNSLLGETQLEVGDYEGARASFAAVVAPTASSGTLASAARWAELQGQTREARRLLRIARTMATKLPDMPAAEIAWFDMRDGDLALREGQPRSAEAAYRRGLALAPTDYRLQAAMSRLALALGRWNEAIAYGEASIAGVLDPGSLGVIADAHAGKGDTARAAEYERTMEVALSGQPGAYHRAWSLYMLDHGRRAPEMVTLALEELKTRRDVYGYDIAAWALHKANRNAEAREMMAAALRLGTRDPLLFYHAGAIAHAAGDVGGARGYLTQALALDPVSRPQYAAMARRILAEAAQ